MSTLHGAGRGEHHAAGDVTSRIDIRRRRAHVVVNDDRTAVIDVDTDHIQAKIGGVRALAHADDGVGSAEDPSVPGFDDYVIAVEVNIRDPRVHLDFHAAGQKRFLDDLGNILVFVGEDLRASG